MVGKKESTPISKGEQLQTTQKPLVGPDVVQQTTRPTFALKLSEVRASSQTNLQRLNILLKGEPRVPQTQVEGENPPPDAHLLLEELVNGKGLSSSEYLRKSAIALGGATRLRQQVTAEIEALERSKRSTWQIEDRLEELDRLRGLKRIPAVLERRRLNRQIAAIQQEVAALSSQVQTKRDLLAQIQEQEEPVKQRREEMLLSEISQAVQDVKSGYEQLLQEVFKDGTIPLEIRNLHIQQVIEPQLVELVKDKKLPAEKKAEFYQALNAYLDHRGSPEDEIQPFEAALTGWWLKAGFSYVVADYRALLNGGDTEIVQGLVAKLAAEDIVAIRSSVEQHYSGWEFRQRFATAFEMAIEPDRWSWNWDRNSFGSQILSALNISSDEHLPDMRFWQAVKNSPAANQVFGEFIRQQDQKYYQTALEKSLSDRDGGYIDLLRYYPTPDSIRNLVILASADAQEYRTVHANWSLASLSKRTDWKNLLDEAEKAYPSLKSARQLLKSWTYTQHNNHPGIKETVGDFALDIFGSKPVSRLTGLAAESLTNGSILTILIKRGVLSEQEEATLREADTFLKQISEEAWKRHRENDYSIPYINEYSFRQGLRENLFALLGQEARGSDEQRMAIVKRFEILSQAILENKTNYPALDYLTDGSVIKRIKDTSFRSETLPVFLVAYQTCPALLTNNNLLGEFCRQFEGEQSVTFFRDMSVAYQDQEQQLNQIVALVGKGALSKARALELPTKAGEVLSSPQFSIAIEFPQLFLETDDGVDFFTQANTASLFSLDRGLEVRIGERIRNLQRDGTLRFSELLIKIAPHEIEQIDRLLSSESPIEANQQNWQQLLMGYVRAQSDMWGLPKLSQVSTDRINTLFNDPKVRDLCLNGLRNSWLTYLKSGKPEEVPFSLNLMSEFINYCGGAGPLSQLESLNSLISSVNLAFARETTVEGTKLEISQGIVAMEDRFTKERWSNEDRTDFYNISRDILGAAPSLFSDYLALFEKLTPSQMRSFAKDIYPLYRTKLVLMEKKDEKGHRTFDKEQLLHIRKDIRGFADVFNAGEKPFEVQKQKLLEEIRGLFKDRFGVIKIPQEFISEHMRSFTNVSTYLANLHGRTPDKETVLGFYLSLMINDRWDNFRRGETVDPSEYLTPEKSSIINRFLEERQRLNPLAPESLGIAQEDMPEFLKLLQQETQNMVVGSIETIDVKLTNIILNLQGLEDLDLYPDALDKQRMQLLLDWGNKRVGSVVARMYQSLATPGRSIQFSEEDTKIQQQIARTIQELGLSLTPQTLKEHFQDGIKPLATVVNLLNFVVDTRAEQEIEALRDLLKPSQEVIEVFRRLGEDFKPTSGAMALSQDLSYLDNLIVKREDELQPQEKALLTEYTTNVRTQMVKLEGLYSQIKNKFGGLKQGGNGSRNPLLQDKLDQIDRIVNAQTTQQAITSTATNNLNVIIENIRACLSCTREGFNNDTNLTFGDMNKFYLYSQSETQQRGSISDQLVFIEPVTRADGSQEITFVLDRIYGTNTPTILENQIEAVLKKYRTIKQRFPGIRLSVFVSDAAISTGGTSPDMLLERFKSKNISAEKEIVEVNVVESATGDHYIEFSGNGRAAGKRQVGGIAISS